MARNLAAGEAIKIGELQDLALLRGQVREPAAPRRAGPRAICPRGRHGRDGRGQAGRRPQGGRRGAPLLPRLGMHGLQ